MKFWIAMVIAEAIEVLSVWSQS